EEFAERQRRTIAGAQALAAQLQGAGHGVSVLTGGTDVHLILVDLRDIDPEITGREAEDRLAEIDITVNRNAVPFDPRPPMQASGLRIGTPALATRGFGEAVIAEALIADAGADLSGLRTRVQALAAAHPLYPSVDNLA